MKPRSLQPDQKPAPIDHDDAVRQRWLSEVFNRLRLVLRSDDRLRLHQRDRIMAKHVAQRRELSTKTVQNADGIEMLSLMMKSWNPNDDDAKEIDRRTARAIEIREAVKHALGLDGLWSEWYNHASSVSKCERVGMLLSAGSVLAQYHVICPCQVAMSTPRTGRRGMTDAEMDQRAADADRLAEVLV